jgi:hypothetical protein
MTMNMTIYRDEATQMQEGHDEGWHEDAPRDGCPSCMRRELSSYPERPPKGEKRHKGMTTTYTHAAPYIREQALNAAARRLTATTQKSKREHTGELMGLIKALKIMAASEDCQDMPIGFAEFTAGPFTEVFAEVERFVGGAHEMQALGFTEGSAGHGHQH